MTKEGLPLFREHGRQVAALCWRAQSTSNADLEVLLITSLTSKRWILPKGWPKAQKSLAESAACEAFEEAGVVGEINPEPLGCYYYLKARNNGGALACCVEVFTMKVTAQSQNWPDKGARSLAWLSIEQAATKVAEPGLRQLLQNFRKHRVQRKQHALR